MLERMAPGSVLVPRPRVLLPPTYLKGLWAFGLGSGATLFDRSRYRAHGAISGASWATGLHGMALQFDTSVDDYVEVTANISQLQFTSEDFSGIARVKATNLDSLRWICASGQEGVSGFDFFVEVGGYLCLFISDADGYNEIWSDPGAIALNTWHTAGFSRSGSSVKVYVDGADVTYWAQAVPDPAPSELSFKIGTWYDPWCYCFDGLIEFLAIIGGIALSASEHKAWHNALA